LLKGLSHQSELAESGTCGWIEHIDIDIDRLFSSGSWFSKHNKLKINRFVGNRDIFKWKGGWENLDQSIWGEKYKIGTRYRGKN
jgi:hypothetical protein